MRQKLLNIQRGRLPPPGQTSSQQSTAGEEPVQVGKVYHNKEFADKCETTGLHSKLGEGYHLKVVDGSFEILMNELGIKPPGETAHLPDDLDLDWFKKLLEDLGKDRKGKSTLKKWCCPECRVKVRIGIADDAKLRHHACEKPDGLPVFLVPGDVYFVKNTIN